MSKAAPYDVLLPRQMMPATAERVAAVLVGGEPNDALTAHVCLAFLKVSWSSTKAQPLSRYLTALSHRHCAAHVSRAIELAVAPRGRTRHALNAAGQWHARTLTELGEPFAALYWDARALAAYTRAAGPDNLAQTCAEVEDALAAPASAGSPFYGTQAFAATETLGSIPVLGTLSYIPNPAGSSTNRTARGSSGAAIAAAAEGAKLAVATAATPQLQLFSPAAAQAALAKLSRPGQGDDHALQRRTLEAMGSESGKRALVEAPAGTPLDELYRQFPHFKDVLDYVARGLALAACGSDGRVARLAPLLLRGAPGTGKTYFAQRLAQVLGTPFIERDLSVTSDAFVISGMDSTWRGAKPGIVFDALVNGKAANPLVCLNEVDKAMVGEGRNSPLSSLYALLEPTSSRQFVDECIPVAVDASAVLWVLTANEGFIPAPVLSRLEVFHIKAPSREESQAIAHSVWASLRSQALPRGHGFDAELSSELLHRVAALSPRVMRKALTFAAGNAAFEDRRTLHPKDLAEAQRRYNAQSAPRIGF